MFKIGIVGATGYTGAELLRLAAGHPEFQVHAVTSRGEAGTPVGAYWPALAGLYDLNFVAPDPDLLAECDCVFFATPNGTAMQSVPELLRAGVRVVDLSADFRLKSAAVWSQWYGAEHACPDLLADAVYGLTELHRDRIRGARLVANPGCYPTAVVLGLLPLLEDGLIDPGRIIANAASGVSGAGRTLSIGKLYGEVAESFKAYGVQGHRHHPEIVQTLGEVTAVPVGLTFIPHLLPMFRGMHITIYADLIESAADVQAAFVRRYRDEAFVTVEAPGSQPDTASVRGSNVCRIAAHAFPERRQTIVLAVIDNLAKGAAGQALQNANLMLGLNETTGLERPPLCP